ncbi:MAG TPA: ABC transporter permease [Solirubrobacteraceae bacterium]|jgi:ABC-2 type transport system permease protein|nr:ABC transporter permease [Solirubrobacteraceae bacterium]
MLAGYLDAVAAVVRRDMRIFLTYRFRWLTRIVGTLLTLTTFYYVSKLARADAVGNHASYFAFLLVGIVALPVLTGAMTIAQFVRQELVAGNFERFLVSPTGPVVGILAMLLFPVAFALFLAAITMALGILLFGVHVDLGGIPLTLGVMALGCIAFASIGLLFVGALIAFKSSAGVTWVIAGLGLVGGVYFPLSLFPGWIRWAGSVQPLTPTIELLRHLLVGTPLAHAAWVDWLKLAGFAAVLLPVSTYALSQSLKLSRSQGTIMEY